MTLSLIHTHTLSLSHPLSLCLHQIPHKNTKNEIYEAFRCFDAQNTGFIDAIEFKQAMVSLGDPMTDQEFNQMCSDAGCKPTGKIEYERLVNYYFPPK
jgi:Ca2+-binding EF-hand superfamily protein